MYSEDGPGGAAGAGAGAATGAGTGSALSAGLTGAAAGSTAAGAACTGAGCGGGVCARAVCGGVCGRATGGVGAGGGGAGGGGAGTGGGGAGGAGCGTGLGASMSSCTMRRAGLAGCKAHQVNKAPSASASSENAAPNACQFAHRQEAAARARGQASVARAWFMVPARCARPSRSASRRLAVPRRWRP